VYLLTFTHRILQIAGHSDIANVLDSHHQTNGHPFAPHPHQLSSNPTNTIQLNIVESHSHAPWNSKKFKDASFKLSPDTLAYYPPVWKDLLEDAKQYSQIAQATKNPFPSKSYDVRMSIMESLIATVLGWMENSASLEPDYWPDHQKDMAFLISSTSLYGIH